MIEIGGMPSATATGWRWIRIAPQLRRVRYVGIMRPVRLNTLQHNFTKKETMHHTEHTSALSHEWTTLQNNHEQHEKNALLLKLAAVAVLAAGPALALDAAAAIALLLVLWLQEAILRTIQARLGERILRVERLLREDAAQPGAACQLHTEWLASRPGLAGLLTEYGRNMLRPTVAFPHAVLVLLCMARASF